MTIYIYLIHTVVGYAHPVIIDFRAQYTLKAYSKILQPETLAKWMYEDQFF